MADQREALAAAARAATPAAFRQMLLGIDPRSRDQWADQVLGLGDVPADGHDLPAGCVPYLPSPVDTLLRAVDRAAVTPGDVFVDVGSGLGRAAMIVHLLTGAGAVGLEIQAGLADRARTVAARLRLPRVRSIHGDAEDLIGYMALGSVFFFYCPFGGDRLRRVMNALRPLARVRPLRLCFADMPPPELPWLIRDPAPRGAFEPIEICRTTLHTHLSARMSAANAATLAACGCVHSLRRPRVRPDPRPVT